MTPNRLHEKIKQQLSNTLRLNFTWLKIIRFLYPRPHPKMIGDIFKNKQENVHLF